MCMLDNVLARPFCSPHPARQALVVENFRGAQSLARTGCLLEDCSFSIVPIVVEEFVDVHCYLLCLIVGRINIFLESIFEALKPVVSVEERATAVPIIHMNDTFSDLQIFFTQTAGNAEDWRTFPPYTTLVGDHGQSL